MKKKLMFAAAVGLLATFSLPALAQTDTLTMPGKTRTFEDPKITEDNSKILIDTTTSVDSMLDTRRARRHVPMNSKQMGGDMDKPVRTNRPTSDTIKVVRP